MIDPNSRRALGELLHQFVAGRLTNDEFAGRLPRSKDHAVREISRESWYLYDDLHEHRLIGRWRINKSGRDEISRWILFLQSDLPYEWPTQDPLLRLSFLAAGLLTLGGFSWFLRRWYAKHGEIEVWPFIRRSDFSAALERPIYLNGSLAGSS